LSASVNSTSIVCSLFCPMTCCLQRSGECVTHKQRTETARADYFSRTCGKAEHSSSQHPHAGSRATSDRKGSSEGLGV
jgi:hypothetical protein